MPDTSKADEKTTPTTPTKRDIQNKQRAQNTRRRYPPLPENPGHTHPRSAPPSSSTDAETLSRRHAKHAAQNTAPQDHKRKVAGKMAWGSAMTGAGGPAV
ncbi:uncharacterized protein K452DRAFT_985 [Aplosporella prunicola CBS 121167]|uniref:Uncharacterized protein n=1 Tax=Aplosporella prunicola CBS 121167 TaxID=1176127 RepID=A0A6A6BUV3_9PEZI|nr:uncharacterized protein K452DRAFT_985 [Aplosporella prunicola CBS 121167]KAF2147055.1 hypothetical protein K452DRAFT_985 [Aplosporella prunicola CBS 121167]